MKKIFFSMLALSSLTAFAQHSNTLGLTTICGESIFISDIHEQSLSDNPSIAIEPFNQASVYLVPSEKAPQPKIIMCDKDGRRYMITKRADQRSSDPNTIEVLSWNWSNKSNEDVRYGFMHGFYHTVEHYDEELRMRHHSPKSCVSAIYDNDYSCHSFSSPAACAQAPQTSQCFWIP